MPNPNPNAAPNSPNSPLYDPPPETVTLPTLPNDGVQVHSPVKGYTFARFVNTHLNEILKAKHARSFVTAEMLAPCESVYFCFDDHPGMAEKFKELEKRHSYDSFKTHFQFLIEEGDPVPSIVTTADKRKEFMLHGKDNSEFARLAMTLPFPEPCACGSCPTGDDYKEHLKNILYSAGRALINVGTGTLAFIYTAQRVSIPPDLLPLADVETMKDQIRNGKVDCVMFSRQTVYGRPSGAKSGLTQTHSSAWGLVFGEGCSQGAHCEVIGLRELTATGEYVQPVVEWTFQHLFFAYFTALKEQQEQDWDCGDHRLAPVGNANSRPEHRGRHN